MSNNKNDSTDPSQVKETIESRELKSLFSDSETLRMSDLQQRLYSLLGGENTITFKTDEVLNKSRELGRSLLFREETVIKNFDFVSTDSEPALTNIEKDLLAKEEARRINQEANASNTRDVLSSNRESTKEAVKRVFDGLEYPLPQPSEAIKNLSGILFGEKGRREVLDELWADFWVEHQLAVEQGASRSKILRLYLNFYGYVIEGLLKHWIPSWVITLIKPSCVL